MKKVLTIFGIMFCIVVIAMYGCGGSFTETQNPQPDCTSGTLLMTGLTPTSLALTTGQIKTFNAVANVYGTHCLSTSAVIGIGTNTLTSTTASYANNITPWTINNLSIDPSMLSSSTGTITIYLTTTDNRTSPTYYIPWTKQ